MGGGGGDGGRGEDGGRRVKRGEGRTGNKERGEMERGGEGGEKERGERWSKKAGGGGRREEGRCTCRRVEIEMEKRGERGEEGKGEGVLSVNHLLCLLSLRMATQKLCF